MVQEMSIRQKTLNYTGLDGGHRRLSNDVTKQVHRIQLNASSAIGVASVFTSSAESTQYTKHSMLLFRKQI